MSSRERRASYHARLLRIAQRLQRLAIERGHADMANMADEIRLYVLEKSSSPGRGC